MKNRGAFLYEGLLSRSVSIASRGMDSVLWGESEGLFYRLDGGVRVGMTVFVAGDGLWADREAFEDMAI